MSVVAICYDQELNRNAKSMLSTVRFNQCVGERRVSPAAERQRQKAQHHHECGHMIGHKPLHHPTSGRGKISCHARLTMHHFNPPTV